MKYRVPATLPQKDKFITRRMLRKCSAGQLVPSPGCGAKITYVGHKMMIIIMHQSKIDGANETNEWNKYSHQSGNFHMAIPIN